MQGHLIDPCGYCYLPVCSKLVVLPQNLPTCGKCLLSSPTAPLTRKEALSRMVLLFFMCSHHGSAGIFTLLPWVQVPKDVVCLVSVNKSLLFFNFIFIMAGFCYIVSLSVTEGFLNWLCDWAFNNLWHKGICIKPLRIFHHKEAFERTHHIHLLKSISNN